MNICFNKWATNLSSLNDREFEEFLDHAQICEFHAGILEEYEADALPFIKLGFPGISGKTGNSISARDRFPDASELPLYNYKGTSFGLAPMRHRPKGRSIEEEIISEKYKEILKNGFTSENCRKALEMLEKNNSIVQDSWSNTLNKARVLAGLEEKKEAKRILNYVLERYSSNQAVGSVYEVFAWLEELNYNEGDKIDQKLFDRRMDYTNKGLKFYPECYQLWMNGFEIACLKNHVNEAIYYLKGLEKIDNRIARQYVFDCPIKKEISKLDIKLKKEIIKLNPGVELELV